MTVGRACREPGFGRELSRGAVKRGRIKALVPGPARVAVIAVYNRRDLLLGREWDPAVRVVTATVLVAIGWEFARDAGRALGPTLLRRLEPGTAGTVGVLLPPLPPPVAPAPPPPGAGPPPRGALPPRA